MHDVGAGRLGKIDKAPLTVSSVLAEPLMGSLRERHWFSISRQTQGSAVWKICFIADLQREIKPLKTADKSALWLLDISMENPQEQQHSEWQTIQSQIPDENRQKQDLI